jgi:uncharacterized protein
MKTSLIASLSLATLLGLVVGVCVLAADPVPTPAEAAVRTADEAWAKAIAGKALEQTLSFYDPEAMTAGSAMFPARGFPDFRQHWTRLFVRPDFALAWKTDHVGVTELGTIAYSTGIWTIPGKQDSGPYLAVWRKQIDGQWKVLIDAAWKTSPPPVVDRASVQLTRSHEHRITSKAVGDDFVIQVRLPEKYDAANPERYPVLYVLDADYWFGTASEIATFLAMVKEAPPVIVVGIAYGGSRKDWWQKRARDYTPKVRYPETTAKFPLAGAADKFQQFLSTELFPFIEQNYAVRADDRALVGLSFGGTFAVQILFTRAELFQRYIILAPALEWDKKQLFETEAAFRAKNLPLPVSVFFAIGDKDGTAPDFVENWREFDERIKGRGYEKLRWISHLFPDETHVSVYPVALTRGLKVVYAENKVMNLGKPKP